jgi:hypothetical protein
VKKQSIEWAGHGTRLHPNEKPGTFWKYGNLTVFTPAPNNSRTEAKKMFQKHLQRIEVDSNLLQALRKCGARMKRSDQIVFADGTVVSVDRGLAAHHLRHPSASTGIALTRTPAEIHIDLLRFQLEIHEKSLANPGE